MGAPLQVPGRALVQALGRARLHVPGRVLLQALGRAPHPHHLALLLSRFKKSCATASVEATSYLHYMIHLFICLQMSSIAPVLASILYRVLVRVLFITKTCESFRRLLPYYSRESVDVQVLAKRRTCWSCCGIVLNARVGTILAQMFDVRRAT